MEGEGGLLLIVVVLNPRLLLVFPLLFATVALHVAVLVVEGLKVANGNGSEGEGFRASTVSFVSLLILRISEGRRTLVVTPSLPPP